jgi:iron complex outermembrane receptor protein
MTNRASRIGRARMGFAAALLCGTAISTQAFGQQPPAVERVVVTAERRATELQDTPLSILAFTPETLEQRGVDDLMDVSLFAPNLTISGSRGNGVNQPTFMIRGVSGGGGATSERGVALYLDGIYVPRTNGSIFNVLDVERIEVLRGPQGTLFGRNSTGGAVRVFTQRPTDEREGYIRATVGEMNRTDLIGMINIPVTDRFAIRAQGGYLSEDGWVERGPHKLGGSEDLVGRLQARFEVSDDFTADFGFLYSDSSSEGSPQDVETFDMRPGLEGVWDGNFGDWLSDSLEQAGQAPIAPLNDPRIVRDDFTMPDFCFIDDFNPDWDEACALRNDSVYWQADANMQWTLNNSLTLQSTTGVSEMDHVGTTSWQQLGFEARPDNVNSKVFFQDLQLNAALFGGAIDFVTGLNYFYEDSSSGGGLLTRRGTSATVTGPSFANDPDGDGVFGSANGNTGAVGRFGPNGLFLTDDTLTEQQSNSFGWFNSATWHATDRLNLTVGARLAYDQKDYQQTAFRSDNFTPVAGDSTTVQSDDDWTEIDWRGTVDYHLTDANMIYATVSKAYRAGQFSYTINQAASGEAQSGDFIKAIPPEKVINYEAGVRNEFLDGALLLNLTGFYMDWTNRQGASQVQCSTLGIPPADCPVGFVIQIVNSGDVELYGVELDGQWALTNAFSIFGAYAYTDYTLADPVANNGPYLFPEPPQHSGNIGMNYMHLMEGGATVDFNISYAYVGSQETHSSAVTDPIGDSSYRQPDYGLVNARIEWAPNDRYSIALFANNLLDETYAAYSTRFAGGYWDLGGPRRGAGAPDRSSVNVVRGQPRQIGVTLEVNF